jgi:hypothetical protein
MDPVTLATVTSGVTLLAAESAKGLAGQAGQDIWFKIKSILGWREDPALEQVAPEAATRLQNDDLAAREILRLLQENRGTTGSAGAVVGRIDAERMVWIQNQTVTGDFNLTM